MLCTPLTVSLASQSGKLPPRGDRRGLAHSKNVPYEKGAWRQQRIEKRNMMPRACERDSDELPAFGVRLLVTSPNERGVQLFAGVTSLWNMITPSNCFPLTL